jgi:hypothetical protein
MASTNNPSSPEFLSGAQHSSFHDSFLANTSGPLIYVRVVNNLPQGNFQSPAQLSSDNQDLQPPFGQMTEDYPILLASRITLSNKWKRPRKSQVHRISHISLKLTTLIDPPFTTSSNESCSVPNSFGGDGPPQHQLGVSSCQYHIPSYANIMTRSFPTRCARDPGGPQISASLAL